MLHKYTFIHFIETNVFVALTCRAVLPTFGQRKGEFTRGELHRRWTAGDAVADVAEAAHSRRATDWLSLHR